MEYFRKDLGSLFKKEKEIRNRIGKYCKESNRPITTSYSMTATAPFLYILRITILDETRTRQHV